MTTYEATLDFPFKSLTLGQPQAMQGGGSWFTKLTINDGIILIQLPKCNMKNGIVKTKRVTYTDFMYSNVKYEQVLSEWVESLEEACKNLIDKKKHLWFSNELSREDLETMMTSMTRLYKSSTKILMRSYIDTSRRNGNLKCHIYDENERILDSDEIKGNTYMIPLIQLEGIKFTSRSFDIELKLVQVMVLEDKEELSFTKSCMIKRKPSSKVNEKIGLEKPLEDDNSNESEGKISSNEEDAEGIFLKKKIVDENTLENSEKNENTLEKLDDENTLENEAVLESSDLGNNELSEVAIDLNNLDDAEVEESVSSDYNNNDSMSSLTESVDPDLQEISIEVKDEISPKIEEVELNVKDNDEILTLKKPNEVYYEIYKAAREKAKHMKKVALEAYLEAKQIKTKYMLDDLNDSDDDFYFDIEDSEVSGI